MDRSGNCSGSGRGSLIFCLGPHSSVQCVEALERTILCFGGGVNVALAHCHRGVAGDLHQQKGIHDRLAEACEHRVAEAVDHKLIGQLQSLAQFRVLRFA